MQIGLTLPKQKRQQSLPTFSRMCAHPTTLRKKGANKNLWSMSFNGFLTLYLAMTQKIDTLTLTKPKTSAADLSKQVHPLCITAEQRAKIIVHLENGTCRKLMPYHEDPGVFLRNYSKVKNIFIYYKKER